MNGWVRFEHPIKDKSHSSNRLNNYKLQLFLIFLRSILEIVDQLIGGLERVFASEF